jgi:Mg/Co/Ni transporter MgtE
VYSDNSAGGIMTSEPVILEPDTVIAVALAHIRNPDLTPAHAAQVYVCRPPTETPTGRYLGTIHFQRLLREPPTNLLGSVLGEEPQPLRPDEPLNNVANYMATYNMVAAPVVDENGHLLGAVTVDDVLDHLLPEDWRTSQDRDRDDDQGGDNGT